MDNRTVAERLLEYAHYLERRDENLYRIRAYRRAASTVLALDRPLAHIVETEGRDGLKSLPGIGLHLSYTLDGLVRTGEFRTVDDAPEGSRPGVRAAADGVAREPAPLAAHLFGSIDSPDRAF